MKLFSISEAMVALLVVGVYYLIASNQISGISQKPMEQNTPNLSEFAQANPACDGRLNASKIAANF